MQKFVKRDLIWRGKKIIFHQDNAPVHKSVVTIAKLNDLKYEFLDHPPYSSNLAPSDYYRCPNLKKCLAGKRFISNNEDFVTVIGYFPDLNESKKNVGI